MKKFLLSIFAVMLAVFSVQAEEYTYTFSATQFSANGTKTLNNVDWTLSGDGGYWGYEGTKGQQLGSSKKPYKTLTLSTSGISGTITEIVVNTSGASSINASFTVSVGGTQYGSSTKLTTTATAYTFKGTASGDIVLSYTQTSSKAIYIKSISVTYEAGDVAETVATPVINPAGGQITADTEIAITCATEGAQIYYTTDGTTPTTESTLYSGAFKLTAAATVKAIAVANGLDNSAVATADFTFLVVCDIAAFIANEDKDNNTTISGEVVVVAQSGKYLFVQDNSAKIIVYGELDKEYKAGDRLTGIKGKYSPYNGLVEMVPDAESFGEATPGDAIAPVAITLDKLLTTDLLTYVTISDVNIPAGSGKSYTVTDATGTTATMYNTLGIEVPAGVGTITGFVSVFNTTRQLMPLEIVISELVVDIAEPTFTPADGTTFYESLEVTIEAEEGLTVYYSTDNKETYTKGKTLNITETTTVYAYAENADGDVSDIVSATYTKNTPVTPPAEGEATVEVNAKDYFGDATINSISKIVEAPVTLTFAKNNGSTAPAYNKAGDCRIYAEGSITAACSAGNLTRIVFEVSAQGKKRLTDLTPSTGTITIADDHSTITWEGNAPEVVLTVGKNAVYGTDGEGKAGQICFTSFAATYTSGNVETPYYTLTVGEAGYATLFLDFAATIPAEVKAYTVTEVNNGYVTLTQVTGVLPANTGVIVKADEDDYNFVASTETPAVVEGNLLQGTVTATEINVEAYVLGNIDGVGLYKAKMTDGKWLNNANKAYLPATKVPTNVKSLSFRFGEGTTGIENVESAEAVKVIFDLTGRRVEAITAPGIYIVNGKKVLVK